ncbi:MAG TPA: rhodanese-like domain-containing protein [Marinagarivorans sp.]
MGWIDFVAEQWMLVALLLALVVAFVTLEGKKGGKAVSYHEVSRMLNNETAILLDVRDAADYKAGHIIDAINIPHGSLATRLNELDKYKGKHVIVTDKMGQHSGHAGKVLRDAGFEAVRMKGGMMEWMAQKLPVIKANKSKGKKA